MTQRKANKGLDFETLRHGIERCDLDLMLGFYAEDAELKIVNAGAPQSSAFELRGKAEIAKHLRAAFGQGTSHRVEREVIGEEWVAFREACEYPDGSRVAVETTLEVRAGKIFRQVDVVARDTRTDGEEDFGQGLSARNPQPDNYPEVDTTPSDQLLRARQTTQEEDLG